MTGQRVSPNELAPTSFEAQWALDPPGLVAFRRNFVFLCVLFVGLMQRRRFRKHRFRRHRFRRRLFRWLFVFCFSTDADLPKEAYLAKEADRAPQFRFRSMTWTMNRKDQAVRPAAAAEPASA